MLRGQGAFWSRFYEPGSFMVPNAALDVAILGLNAIGFDPQVSALLFVLVAYAVFVGGVCALAAAWEAFDLTKIAFAALLFTTGTLYYGLVNYVLAVGLVLCLLAAWIATRPPARPAWVQVTVAAVGVALLFFCHLIGAVVFVRCWPVSSWPGCWPAALAAGAACPPWWRSRCWCCCATSRRSAVRR